MNKLVISVVLVFALVTVVVGRLLSVGWFNIIAVIVFGGSWIAAVCLYFGEEIWAWFDNRFL